MRLTSPISLISLMKPMRTKTLLPGYYGNYYNSSFRLPHFAFRIYFLPSAFRIYFLPSAFRIYFLHSGHVP